MTMFHYYVSSQLQHIQHRLYRRELAPLVSILFASAKLQIGNVIHDLNRCSIFKAISRPYVVYFKVKVVLCLPIALWWLECCHDLISSC